MRGATKLNRIHTAYFWINPKECEACWDCVDTCKKQVIGKVDFLWHKHVVVRNPNECTGCKTCINVCTHGVFIEW